MNVDAIMELVEAVMEALCRKKHIGSWVTRRQPTVVHSDGYGQATTLYTCKVCGRSWWEAVTIEPETRRR